MAKRKPTEVLPPAAPAPPDPARVEQVLRWILEGNTEHDIAEAVVAHWPDALPQPLLAAAIASLEKSGQFDPGVVIGWCFEAARDVYRRMLDAGDFTGALRAVKYLSDLARAQPLPPEEPTAHDVQPPDHHS